jgi:transcriptional regulator with XRE-family HTH domain
MNAPRTGAPKHCLLDYLLRQQRVKNDAALSRLLLLAPSSISKISRGRSSVSAEVLLRAHEAFGISIAELKRLEREQQAARGETP